MKTCSSCKEEKALTEFRRYGNNRNGLRPNCKQCLSQYNKMFYKSHKKYYNDYNKDHYHKNKNYYKDRELKKKFGLSFDKYEEMLAKQNNKCSICKIDSSMESKKFAVDHCHQTGKIRELLCEKCNLALGLFKEKLETLKSAIEYLTKHN